MLPGVRGATSSKPAFCCGKLLPHPRHQARQVSAAGLCCSVVSPARLGAHRCTPPGAGKSTFLCLLGMLLIRISAQAPRRWPDPAAARSHQGYFLSMEPREIICACRGRALDQIVQASSGHRSAGKKPVKRRNDECFSSAVASADQCRNQHCAWQSGTPKSPRWWTCFILAANRQVAMIQAQKGACADGSGAIAITSRASMHRHNVYFASRIGNRKKPGSIPRRRKRRA